MLCYRMKFVLFILLVLFFLYTFVVVLAMFLENRLVFVPPPVELGDWQPNDLDFEEATFESSDGTKLHGWYFPHAVAKGYVLYCHGNANFVPNLGYFARDLRDQYKLSVAIWDYRGYGKSEGTPHEAGVLADAAAAQRWLMDREGIQARDITLMGRSLGGAVAVHLAADTGACALVLDSAFSSMVDVAAYHYPFLPIRWLMRTQFNSIATIQSYHGPVLQLHGDQDRVVPIEFGQKLYDGIPGDKELFLMEGGDHNGPRPSTFYDRMAQLIYEQTASD